MGAPEFGSHIVSLEWYLDNANPKVLANHEELSGFLDQIDPRLMITTSLVDRMMPLTQENIEEIGRIAKIKAVGEPETITFTDTYYLFDDPLWWEVLGDPVEKVEIYGLNVRLTDIKLSDWKLVLIKRTPATQQADDTPFSLGWVNTDELDLLKADAQEVTTLNIHYPNLQIK